jgi:hypothetical protein
MKGTPIDNNPYVDFEKLYFRNLQLKHIWYAQKKMEQLISSLSNAHYDQNLSGRKEEEEEEFLAFIVNGS